MEIGRREAEAAAKDAGKIKLIFVTALSRDFLDINFKVKKQTSSAVEASPFHVFKGRNSGRTFKNPMKVIRGETRLRSDFRKRWVPYELRIHEINGWFKPPQLGIAFTDQPVRQIEKIRHKVH